jgi:two-component system LytT family response regulator
MTLRVLIADDEPLARERLRQLLQEEPGVEIVGECATGTETVKAIQNESPHLVLLDVRMPELDGFEVIRALGVGRLPTIIFVTAHDEFALRAFEAHAADYLLKPFDRERFQKALCRAREIALRGGENNLVDELLGVIAALKTPPQAVERFAIRSGGRIVFVKPGEIEWIRSADNYSELHVGGTVHLLRQTLAALEQQLPPIKFVRISRSLMVNVDHIKEFRPKSHGDYLVVLYDGIKLSASRNYREGIVFDDLEASEKIKVYDRGISLNSSPEDVYQMLVAYRTGDMWAPQLEVAEALSVEAAHFVDCVTSGTRPATDGEAGLRVVRLLEAATESMLDRGRLVSPQGVVTL